MPKGYWVSDPWKSGMAIVVRTGESLVHADSKTVCNGEGGQLIKFNNLKENVRDMRNPEKVLNSLSEHSGNSGYKFERLYRVLFNEEMYYVAYQRIYAKQGNMTAGIDGQTVSGMSIERIKQLIDSLKNETYQPNPSKRVRP